MPHSRKVVATIMYVVRLSHRLVTLIPYYPARLPLQALDSTSSEGLQVALEAWQDYRCGCLEIPIGA